MYLEERRRKILEELEKNGTVRVADISRQLNCSEVTIRNDIQAMHESGLLRRVHGGAILPAAASAEEQYLPDDPTLHRHEAEKREIAAAAYKLVKPQDMILIDDATTSYYLAMQIRDNPEKPVAVVTNSLLVGVLLHGAKHVDLYMVGGSVGGRHAATFGEAAVHFISGLHVDKAFIGVHSINMDVGFTSIAAPQMEVKKAILKSTDKVFVLADSSKFEGGYLFVVGPMTSAYQIITDSKVRPEYVERARRENIPLVIAD
ncbi:MAG: DeoR/GlpR transcriptional regulator [Lachnospiraceae bacterium]|nr:DeoR/GlpR transcriptional regulator [Lachnospiraceae bacterium]